MPDPQTGSTPPALEFTSSGALTVPTSTDGSFGASADLYGVVMFVPSTANETLTFNVTTQYGGAAKTLPTKTSRVYAAAKAYKIVIEFKNGGLISIDAGPNGDGDGSITEWVSASGGTDETLEATS
jgi:hypothetical protein